MRALRSRRFASSSSAASRDRFHVRRQPLANARHCGRLRGIVTPGSAADDAIARADGEEDLGEGRKQRNDAVDRLAVRPSARRAATADQEENSEQKAALHHPSREGTSGGANEDVSWLRANRRPAFPGCSPVAEPLLQCPLQWRGRAGFAPASVILVRELVTAVSL